MKHTETCLTCTSLAP